MDHVARRLRPFGVTIFTEMSALAAEVGAINLGQGFPNWDGAAMAKEAAIASMASGNDQYPPSHGIPQLRRAIARRYGPRLGRTIDPDSEITVTTGCTEALAAAMLGLVEPGDEVVVIEPFYDAYPADLALAGAIPKFVTLRPPEFALDPDELASAFSARTRAILVNTPHNPTGRVLTTGELDAIARLCVEHDAVAVTDEVYEEMVFERPHLRLGGREGMWDRTLTLSSLGKTFSLTGWKVGWAIGPSDLTEAVRAAHQFLTFTTPTPVQHGAVAALDAPDSFFDQLRAAYRARRDLLASGLNAAGFEVYPTEGTYFTMAGYRALSDAGDREFCRQMVERAGVVAIPPGVFYHEPADGSGLVRFAFCKDEATLTEAVERLGKLSTG